MRHDCNTSPSRADGIADGAGFKYWLGEETNDSTDNVDSLIDADEDRDAVQEACPTGRVWPRLLSTVRPEEIPPA